MVSPDCAGGTTTLGRMSARRGAMERLSNEGGTKWRALRALMSLFIGMLLPGCAPSRLLTVPAGWSREIQGRELYHTPRGYIYATDAGTAGWMDRYLGQRLPRIEERFGIKLGRGVIIAIAPVDSPMKVVARWPSFRVRGIPRITLPSVDGCILGLPKPTRDTYAWVCALPTDSFYHEVVSYEHQAVDREFWNQLASDRVSILTSWPFLLLRPAQRKEYLARSDVDRERTLAVTAIEHSTVPEAEKTSALTRVRGFYDERRRAIPSPSCSR